MIKAGILYIVATPIGNLEDITLRAIRILKEVSLVVAEDTRQTKKLLQHFDIANPTLSYFEHNRFKRIPKIIQHLMGGNDVALVSDAGTPGISDPAYRLIREAIEGNIKIEAIPGPSAFITALAASGLPTDRFIFEGFLPHKKGRKGKLNRLADFDGTVIFYESPKRILRTLSDVLHYLGDRPAVIGRELTKIHEELIRGKVSELLSYFKQNTPRGEFVIMISKNDQNVYF